MFVQKCVLQGYQSLGFKLYLLLVKGIARPWPSQKWLLITIYDTLSTESVVFLHGKLNSSPSKTKFTCLSFWSMFCPINALIFFLKITRESVRTFKSNKTRFICICFETFFGDLLNFQILIYQKIAHTNDNEQKEDQIVILIFFLKTDRYVSKSLLISIGFWSII